MQKNMSLNPLQAYISMHFLKCCSLYIPCGTCKENLSNNPELPKKTIISFILVTLMFMLIGDAVGSIRCLLLLVVKGLKHLKRRLHYHRVKSVSENDLSEYYLYFVFLRPLTD